METVQLVSLKNLLSYQKSQRKYKIFKGFIISLCVDKVKQEYYHRQLTALWTGQFYCSSNTVLKFGENSASIVGFAFRWLIWAVSFQVSSQFLFLKYLHLPFPPEIRLVFVIHSWCKSTFAFCCDFNRFVLTMTGVKDKIWNIIKISSFSLPLSPWRLVCRRGFPLKCNLQDTLIQLISGESAKERMHVLDHIIH